jgi:hypothetical protein
MADKFRTHYPDLSAPAEHAFHIDPSDTDVFEQPTRFLYVGVTGDVAVRFAKDGQEVFYQAVPAGTLLRIRVDRVYATGTTASALVGEY